MASNIVGGSTGIQFGSHVRLFNVHDNSIAAGGIDLSSNLNYLLFYPSTSDITGHTTAVGCTSQPCFSG